MIGLHGVRVDRPQEVGPAWDEVLAADRPAVLEVVTDPEVPPLPPHIRFEQAAGLAQALIKGERSRRAIIGEAIKGKLAELTTR